MVFVSVKVHACTCTYVLGQYDNIFGSCAGLRRIVKSPQYVAVHADGVVCRLETNPRSALTLTNNMYNN